LGRRKLIVFNKIDLVEDEKQLEKLASIFAKKNISVLAISALTGSGIDALKQYVTETLEEGFDA